MSAANTLGKLFRLLNRNQNVIPQQQTLRELSDYADFIDVNPDKAVASLENYMRRPDTNDLLLNFARGHVNVDWDNPLTQEILERGWVDASYMAPQFRNFFRRSVITEPYAPIVKIGNTPPLTVPETQFQGAGTSIDYIDDALRNLTASDSQRSTGIWTGTPYSRAQNYARNAAPEGQVGEVNDLFVRMEHPLILDANGRRWYALRDAEVDRRSLPMSMEHELVSQYDEEAAKLWRNMPEDSRKRVIDYKEAADNYFDWVENKYQPQVDAAVEQFVKDYKDDPRYLLLNKNLKAQGKPPIEDIYKNSSDFPYTDDATFSLWLNMRESGAFAPFESLKWRRNKMYESIPSKLEKDYYAENYLYAENAALATGDTLLDAVLRTGYKDYDLLPGKRLPKVTVRTDDISRIIKNDIDDIADGVVMNNIRDGADTTGDLIIARNVVPNHNEQVKRATGNFTFNPDAKEWSKGIASAGTAGYLGSKMIAPTDAQASVRLPSPSQGLGESWNPIESMLVGAGTGALAGAGAAGVGAIPGAVGGALGGLIFDGLMEAGVPYVYNNYIEPNAKEYAKNFVFTPPVLED